MPNRKPLNVISHVSAGYVRSWRAKDRPQLQPWRSPGGPTGNSNTRVSISFVLVNWAGLVALWALPYLTLLDHLRFDAARSEVLQWSLLIIGALGLVSILYTAWKETLDPVWRARHGSPPHKRPHRPNTRNVA
ncbi:MAG TPA: hypothetical protein VKD19_04780 [Pseudolabrys sp.]|nr:hypothetical protein [Pseudolabrys sp.]